MKRTEAEQRISDAAKNRTRVLFTRAEIARLHRLLKRIEIFEPLREAGDRALKQKFANTLIKWSDENGTP